MHLHGISQKSTNSVTQVAPAAGLPPKPASRPFVCLQAQPNPNSRMGLDSGKLVGTQNHALTPHFAKFTNSVTQVLPNVQQLIASASPLIYSRDVARLLYPLYMNTVVRLTWSLLLLTAV